MKRREEVDKYREMGEDELRAEARLRESLFRLNFKLRSARWMRSSAFARKESAGEDRNNLRPAKLIGRKEWQRIKKSASANAAAPPEGKESRANRSQKVGTVTSDKMQKTVVVRVDRLVRHRKYRRYVRRTSKFMAHDGSARQSATRCASLKRVHFRRASVGV